MTSYDRLAEEDRLLLDQHILGGKRLPGIQLIRDRLGLELHQALQVFTNRYDYLRAHSDKQFTVSHEEYWKDFYS